MYCIKWFHNHFCRVRGKSFFYYQLGWALVLLKLRYYGYLHRLLSKHCTGYPWMSIPMNWTQIECCIIHSHHWNISLLTWQTYHYNTNKHTGKCRSSKMQLQLYKQIDWWAHGSRMGLGFDDCRDFWMSYPLLTDDQAVY